LSIENGREHFRALGIEDRVLEFDVSSATVPLAAKALGVEHGKIAKTLSFKSPEGEIFLVLAAGDVKIDNKKFRQAFKCKAKMLTPEEALELVGHPIGGVCPFGIKAGVSVYLDESLKRFETVFPSVGSPNSAIELNIEELYKYSYAKSWVDVSKLD
jgi:prolyl-tRNA editing enzyme YbaK/EbsC (Cys-tRNA(Pro) deacylase)